MSIHSFLIWLDFILCFACVSFKDFYYNCTLFPMSPWTPGGPGGPFSPFLPGLPGDPLKPGKPEKPVAPCIKPSWKFYHTRLFNTLPKLELMHFMKQWKCLNPCLTHSQAQKSVMVNTHMYVNLLPFLLSLLVHHQHLCSPILPCHPDIW